MFDGLVNIEDTVLGSSAIVLPKSFTSSQSIANSTVIEHVSLMGLRFKIPTALVLDVFTVKILTWIQALPRELH